ncbi:MULTISPECIES: hypothetical protein [unclassified Psychrobacter]|uniref:hypothetical protein n=1 Tax=unclassified Psychrobacter TaxID=196806 RepID=UPI003F462AFB
MSSTVTFIPTHKTKNNSAKKPFHLALIVNMGYALIISILLLSAVGCSTTQAFKPTASVIVGGHKTL